MNRTDIISAITAYLRRHGLTSTSISAALIDMDGTLYDSMPNHCLAWHRMISELGLPSDPDEYFLYEGMTGEATINMLFRRYTHRSATPEESRELYHRKTTYFSQMPPVSIMPGAPKMLSELQRLGLTPVLVTGSGQASLIDALNRDFPGVFKPELMVTSHSVSRGKPDPEPYLKGQQLARVSPRQAVVIENAPLGVESGSRSGAFTIGVTTGPIPEEKFFEAGADIVFPSMQVLADNIKTLIEAFADTRL